MKNTLTVVLLAILCNTAFGQKTSIVDFGITLQNFFFNHSEFSVQDIQTILPNSDILANELNSAYSQKSVPIHSTSSINIWAGFQFGEKDNKHRPTLRIGLTLGSHYLSLGDFSTGHQRFTIDTLRSAAGNNEATIDSINNRTIITGFEHENIGFQASYIVYWNAESRWTMYTGLGVGAAVSFASNLRAYHYERTSEQINYDGVSLNNPKKYDFNSLQNERFDGGTGFFGQIHIPIGLDFRIGKNPDNFWGHSHLFFELNPGILFHNVADHQVSVSSGLMQTFGFRVTF